jgi:glycosyltransferase involved in cell wall biosynthesis
MIQKDSIDISVVVSVYNSPRSLAMCLSALAQQTFTNFEVIIADDGSDDSVAGLLTEGKYSSLRLRHIRQEDRGYRRSLIMNKGICGARADYIVVMDGDIVARPDYLANHMKWRRKGYWLSANRINIPESVHRRFTEDDVRSGRVFDYAWLQARYPEIRKYRYRVACPAALERLLNRLTHRPAVFMGANSSAWKEDLLRVNGFDNEFVYHGSEDRELGVRLHNAGVHNLWLKYSLICLHLDHAKPYRDPVQAERNRSRMKRRKRDGVSWVDAGISAIDNEDCRELVNSVQLATDTRLR